MDKQINEPDYLPPPRMTGMGGGGVWNNAHQVLCHQNNAHQELCPSHIFQGWNIDHQSNNAKLAPVRL